MARRYTSSVLFLEAPLGKLGTFARGERRASNILNPYLDLLGYNSVVFDLYSPSHLTPALRYARSHKNVDVIYISSHGEKDSLRFGQSEKRHWIHWERDPERDPYTHVLREEFANLKNKYLIFSSCNFLTKKRAKEILEVSKAKLVAGYGGITYDDACGVLDCLLFYRISQARTRSDLKKYFAEAARIAKTLRFRRIEFNYAIR